MPTARIPFSNRLLDDRQPATLKVIEEGGKLQLYLCLGIIASKVPDIDNPSAEIKLKNRDAVITKNLIINGTANISMKKRSDTDATADFTVIFNGNGGVKIPGTGDVEFNLTNQDLESLESFELTEVKSI
jgi:hypothetical protein